MKWVLAALAAVAGVVIVLAMWAMGAYNGFVRLQEGVNGAWAQVQNDYQRRADLVPNLVETVKGAANFEKSTMVEVTEARSKVGSLTVDKSILSDPAKFKQFEAAQGQLGSALSHLMVVMEKYPDLKASENFRNLQVQLEGTENRITVARRDFNDAAVAYNTAIRQMPGALMAGIGGFKAKTYFEAETSAQKVPQVKF